MHIALVNPRYSSSKVSMLYMPHGLLQIAAELKASSHTFEIIDYNDMDTKLDYKYLHSFDIVGISVMTMQLKHAVEMAMALPAGQIVVWGGIHCILDPASVLQRFPSHYVVNGEGEQSLLQLVDSIADGRRAEVERLATLPGVCFADGKEFHIASPHFHSDINTLHDVNFAHLPRLEQYLRSDLYYVLGEHLSLSTLTSRGCRWNCAFCINPLMTKLGGRYRSKSFDKIRRETEWVIDEFKLKFLSPADEDFFGNSGMVDQWANYAKEKGFWWGANCRYNYFKKGFLDEARLAGLCRQGLFQLGMSIEAGDESIRNDVLNKHVRDTDIEEACEVIERSVGNSLAVNTSFIVNFPGDTRQSRIRMLQIMDQLSKRVNITFSGPQAYRPYPGSRLSECGGSFQRGDIDSYISKFASADGFSGTAMGAPLELLDNETYFHTHVARVFFNQRLLFFEICDGAGDVSSLRLSKAGRPMSGMKRLLVFMITLLMIPVLLRIKFNCWKCFVEPAVIGMLARKMDFGLAFLRGLLR